MKQLYYHRDSRSVHYETSAGTVMLHIPGMEPSREIPSAHPVQAILGILRTSRSECLMFVTQSEYQGSMDGRNIFRITELSHVTLRGSSADDDVEGIKSLVESHAFYYCFEDLDEDFSWNACLRGVFNSYKRSSGEEPLGADSPFLSRPPVRYVPTRKPGRAKIKLGDAINNSARIENQLRFFAFGETAPPSAQSQQKVFSGHHAASQIEITHSHPGGPDYMLANVFCGYFETRMHYDDTTFFLKMQSMISSRKIGTRMLSRGVDENGNVSFLVETRIVVGNEEAQESFTVVRGSVPLFWSQDDPLRPHKIIFEQEQAENMRAFEEHFRHIEERYGQVVVVDLLGSKKYESMLSRQYREFCKEKKKKYLHFDVNKYTDDFRELKATLYDRLDRLMEEQSDESVCEEEVQGDSTEETNDTYANIQENDDGYNEDGEHISRCMDKCDASSTADEYDGGLQDAAGNCSTQSIVDKYENIKIDAKSNSIVPAEPPRAVRNKAEKPMHDRLSKAIVFRVNCMDCLDRTNLIQFLLFSYFYPYRFKAIRTMWKNNGNALSNFYTGSDALKAELATKGKLSMLGRMNDLLISANRMLNNKFSDKEKQRLINLLLGKVEK